MHYRIKKEVGKSDKIIALGIRHDSLSREMLPIAKFNNSSSFYTGNLDWVLEVYDTYYKEVEDIYDLTVFTKTHPSFDHDLDVLKNDAWINLGSWFHMDSIITKVVENNLRGLDDL